MWTEIWTNNPAERLNREIRGRPDVVGIFLNRQAIVLAADAEIGADAMTALSA